MRSMTFEIPPQEILTKDSVTVFVNAIMYYKVANAIHAVANVDDYGGSSRLLAATTLRNVLGTLTLGDILSQRESIAREMRESLDVATEPWGVKVERVEVKDVRVPEQLQRAMAAEAEAAREARAKVIAAEGEHKASRALRQAAEVIIESPAALQLRYLQTLNSISAENNSTIIFPVPIDIMNSFMPNNNFNQPLFTTIPNPQQNQTFQHFQNFQENQQNQQFKRSQEQVKQSFLTQKKFQYQNEVALDRQREGKVSQLITDNFDDIDLPKVDSLDVDLDIAEIDFKIPENELAISGLSTKSNW